MKNYLIIGGSSGIGLEITRKLVQQDNNVFVVSRKSDEQLEKLKIKHIALDVVTNDLGELDSVLPEAIDGLIYCPGTINLKPFARYTLDDFRDDYEINVLGAVKVIKAVINRLKKSENSSVVTFSTVAASTGMNFHSSIATAKAALHGLTVSLAAEYASSNIRFNCIAPSLTDTPLAKRLLNSEDKKQRSADRHPIKRVGTSNDMADLAIFLLSGQSGWITGQIINVDGGMSSLRPF